MANSVEDRLQGYRITWDGGKTVWLGTKNGNVFIVNEAGGLQVLELGPIQYDKWVDYCWVVQLSTDPSSGRVEVFMDGDYIGSIIGQATALFEQYRTDMFVNVVDFNGVAGTADFDNLQISRDECPLIISNRNTDGILQESD